MTFKIIKNKHMKSRILKLIIVLIAIVNINTVFAQVTGSFTDDRDGKSYKTVQIGGQTWMAENLNYKSPASMAYYGTTKFASITWWNDSIEYTKKYGRLYTYKVALEICPNGWHLPSQEEWNTVDAIAGGRPSGAKKLKSAEGWKKEGNGTNSIGFNVLPAGNYNKRNNEFFGLTVFADFWTSTIAPSDYKGEAYYRSFGYKKDRIFSNFSNLENGLSVRCVSDKK